MREQELFSLYCGDTLIEVWGEDFSMDCITDYRIGDVSVLEMIYSLDKEGKFEQSVYEKMYEIRNS
jgi:hypothetical protein